MRAGSRWENGRPEDVSRRGRQCDWPRCGAVRRWGGRRHEQEGGGEESDEHGGHRSNELLNRLANDAGVAPFLGGVREVRLKRGGNGRPYLECNVFRPRANSCARVAGRVLRDGGGRAQSHQASQTAHSGRSQRAARRDNGCRAIVRDSLRHTALVFRALPVVEHSEWTTAPKEKIQFASSTRRILVDESQHVYHNGPPINSCQRIRQSSIVGALAPKMPDAKRLQLVRDGISATGE